MLSSLVHPHLFLGKSPMVALVHECEITCNKWRVGWTRRMVDDRPGLSKRDYMCMLAQGAPVASHTKTIKHLQNNMEHINIDPPIAKSICFFTLAHQSNYQLDKVPHSLELTSAPQRLSFPSLVGNSIPRGSCNSFVTLSGPAGFAKTVREQSRTHLMLC